MKDLFRELIFVTICGIVAVVVIQITVDFLDMFRQIREERRRADHPANGKPRYE